MPSDGVIEGVADMPVGVTEIIAADTDGDTGIDGDTIVTENDGVADTAIELGLGVTVPGVCVSVGVENIEGVGVIVPSTNGDTDSDIGGEFDGVTVSTIGGVSVGVCVIDGVTEEGVTDGLTADVLTVCDGDGGSGDIVIDGVTAGVCGVNVILGVIDGVGGEIVGVGDAGVCV
jgi:hypothetical protein